METVFTSIPLGFLVGVVLALTGAGATFIAVPLLILGVHLEVAEAAPIALLAICAASTIAAFHAHLQGTVRYRAAGFIAVTGIMAVHLGLWLAHKLPNAPLTFLFALILFAVAVDVWRHAEKQPPEIAAKDAQRELHTLPTPCQLEYDGGRLRWTWPCVRALALAGALVGFLSGLLGVGGGFVVVPVLKRVSNLTMQSIVATSLAVVGLISAMGVIYATAMSQLDWSIAFPFTFGTLTGMMIGRIFALRLTGPRLQQGFAVIAVIMAAVMLFRVMSTLPH